MVTSPSGDGDGLLTEEEIQLFRRVQRSKVWRLIADSLCYERERLFSGDSSVSGLRDQPSSNEQLWKNQGAILLIQHLLQTGPQLVIWYRRHLEAQEAERDAVKVVSKQSTDEGERVYTPGSDPELSEKPDFDL